jgi:drug/metabolite transporter (DMT)-like permease
VWVLLALVAALCQVLRNTVMKRLGHSLDEYINVWGRFTFLLPFAAMFVLGNGVPEIKPGFWPACACFAVSQTISTMALSKALKLAEISMVTALWKVSLLILVVLGYFTLREHPTPLGVAGILISMAGVYLLNVNRAHIAWWAPFAVLFTDRGLRYTLLAALFYAPSVVTIKWAMQCSDQYMGTLGGYLAASLLVTPIVLRTSARHFAEIPRYWKAFVSFGLFAALTTVSQGTAYLMTLSSYVEAVKQVEILFAMGIGAVLFHEKQKVRDIAPGAVVMLIGVVLLSLAG